MANKMTWDERRKMHLDEYHAHRDIAVSALHRYSTEGYNRDDWNLYKEEMKIANKHWGIANAMFTKKYGKI